MEKKMDVVVVGNVGIDTNVYFYGEKIDFSHEANFTENIDYVGQAGGYASRGYAQLGKRTAFIGTLGEDYHGEFIRKTFTRDGIDQSGIFIDPAGTARSINFMYRDGRRKNFYDGKNHMHLMPDMEMCAQIFSQTQLAHFNIPNWARYLLPVAREKGVIIAVDIQDVVDIWDPYRQDFIENADFIFLSSTNHPDPTPLIHAILSGKPEVVIIVGMGARGAALGTSHGVRFFPPVQMDLPVIDTNGAGDGLVVGFLTSYVLDGFSLEDAILRGQITARYTCTQKANSNSLITKDQLENYFSLNQGRYISPFQDG